MAQSVKLEGKISDFVKQNYEKNLQDNIKKFQLVNTDNKVYFEDKVEKVFYGQDGVLTTTFMISYDTAFKDTNKYFRIVDDKENVLTEIETPEIVYDFGFGGLQTVKFPFSGNEPGKMVFANTDYVDRTDMDEIFLPGVVALANNFGNIQNVVLDTRETLRKNLTEIKNDSNVFKEKISKNFSEFQSVLNNNVVEKVDSLFSKTPELNIPKILTESQNFILPLPEGFEDFIINVDFGKIKREGKNFIWQIPQVSKDTTATLKVYGIEVGKVKSHPLIKEIVIKNIPMKADTALVNNDFKSNAFKTKNITF